MSLARPRRTRGLTASLTVWGAGCDAAGLPARERLLPSLQPQPEGDSLGGAEREADYAHAPRACASPSSPLRASRRRRRGPPWSGWERSSTADVQPQAAEAAAAGSRTRTRFSASLALDANAVT